MKILKMCKKIKKFEYIPIVHDWLKSDITYLVVFVLQKYFIFFV
jgi:hypothetical protein